MSRKQQRTMHELRGLKKECKAKIVANNMHYTAFMNWSKKRYGMGTKWATKLWKICWADLEASASKSDLIKVRHVINGLNELSDNTDPRIRLKAFEQLRKLGGLDESDKMDVTHSGDITITWGNQKPK